MLGFYCLVTLFRMGLSTDFRCSLDIILLKLVWAGWNWYRLYSLTTLRILYHVYKWGPSKTYVRKKLSHTKVNLSKIIQLRGTGISKPGQICKLIALFRPSHIIYNGSSVYLTFTEKNKFRLFTLSRTESPKATSCPDYETQSASNHSKLTRNVYITCKTHFRAFFLFQKEPHDPVHL